MKWYEDPVYLKMSDCPEIQDEWQPRYGDYLAGIWFIDEEDNLGLTSLGIVKSYDEEKGLLNTGGDILWNRETNIWLPRQDQLQEMVLPDTSDIDKADLFYSFLNQPAAAGVFKFVEDVGIRAALSMEQLWLAFVMKEKYNKTWSGEVWEKITV